MLKQLLRPMIIHTQLIGKCFYI